MTGIKVGTAVIITGLGLFWSGQPFLGPLGTIMIAATLAVLGRWMFFYPDRYLNPDGNARPKSYLRGVRRLGALILWGSVLVILLFVSLPLAIIIPNFMSSQVAFG